MPEETYVLGVDIGGTHISSAVVAVNEKKMLEATYATGRVANMEPQESILQTWADTLNTSIGLAKEKRLKGIAFAMPGPFDYKEGIALYPEGFKYGALNGIHIEKAVQPILRQSKLPMRFLNDATSFAVGEAWLSEDKGYDKQLCITLGTGLGAGFIDKGVPVVNSDNVPPEGCLWNLPYKEGIADDYFSTRGCINAYTNLTGVTVNGVKALAEVYDSDVKCQEVFNTFGEDFGVFLTPWLKKFGADTLVLGGNISKAYACFGHALERSLNVNGISSPVRISTHMEKGAIIGCTRVFDEQFWASVKDDLPRM